MMFKPKNSCTPVLIQKRVVLLGTCDGYTAIKRTSHYNPGLSLPGPNDPGPKDAYSDPRINIQVGSKHINHSDFKCSTDTRTHLDLTTYILCSTNTKTMYPVMHIH